MKTTRASFPGILCALALLAASPAQADHLIGEYTAYIGDADLHNSNGERLTKAWQIIRQDRANYHLYGIRQTGDEDDDFFASKDNRAIAEQMLRRGAMSDVTARGIVNGHVMIRVKIYGHGSQGEYLDVSLLD